MAGTAAIFGPEMVYHSPKVKIVLVLVTVALSWFSYNYIERPMMAKRQKLAPVLVP